MLDPETVLPQVVFIPRVRMWIGTIALLCLFSSNLAVKREDFKTCDQSSFCKRHRDVINTGYEVIPSSVAHSGSIFSATLKNSENQLSLKIFGLEDSTVRVQIDETSVALRKRFVPSLALDGEPTQLAFSNVAIKSDSAVLLGGHKKIKVIVNYSPFMIDLYNEFDELVGQLNRDQKLKVEEYRTKEEEKEYPDGFWDETFKSFTDSKPFGSSSIGLDVSFVGFKHAYGLPEHADSFALKTTVGSTDPYRLYNLDVFEYEVNNPMALYVAIPYIVAHNSKRTVGALWLNAAETWIDTTSSTAQKGFFRTMMDKMMPGDTQIPHFDAHFMSETGVVDVFFFVGPRPQDVQRQYAAVTGVTALPPIFSIAYHQCRWNYNDEQDVAQVNAGFDKWDIPMDVIWLDIEHTDGKKYFTWDQHKFAHPQEMINNVSKSGRKMVTIIDPHIKKDDSYNVYKDAKDLGLFVKRADGTSDFEGHCWPGASEYLDFLHPETRKYWASQFKFDRYIGSTPDLFTWNDMNEPSVFSGPEITMDKDALHYGGIEHREVHNMYGMYYHSATFEGQLVRTEGRDRPFILTRSGFVGTQRTAAIWTGDNTAEWQHLAIAAPMILSLSVAGNPFVGADVGGFFGNPDEQLLTRWYQAGAFQPFFRAHAHIDTKRREPWLMSEQTRNIIRDTIRMRYQLLPYWYSLFRDHSISGLPPMRPIWYEFPAQEKYFDEEKAWMLGSGLFVRPVVEKDTYSVQVDLPSNENGRTRWFHWESGVETVAGAQNVDAPINHVPVFQQGGSIVPTWQRVRRAASLMIRDPYTLFVALDAKGSAKGSVYSDDGKTHDYRQKQYAAATYEYKTLSATSAQITGTPDSQGIFPADNWVERIVIRGVPTEPKTVTIIRASDPTAKLEFAYDRDHKVLTLRKPLASITVSWRIDIAF